MEGVKGVETDDEDVDEDDDDALNKVLALFMASSLIAILVPFPTLLNIGVAPNPEEGGSYSSSSS